MAKTIGNKLREAREARDMSIDDVAHATRIHATNILGLEGDDYSGFASTTYAKSFLTLYSGYLEVDASEALEQFAGGSSVGFGGPIGGGLAERIDTSERDGYFSRSKSGSGGGGVRRTSSPAGTDQGGAPIFLGLILLLLLIAIPTFWFIGRDAESVEEALDNGKKLSQGNMESLAPKAKPLDVAPEPINPQAAGPNPDAEEQQFPEINDLAPSTPTPRAQPLVAQPVIIPSPTATPVDATTGPPAPTVVTPESEPEPAPEPNKPKNQFGFPGD